MFRLTIILWVSVVMLSGCRDGNRQSDDNTNSPIVPEFNADSAFAFVAEQVGYGPRTLNSYAHSACSDYIAKKMQEYGCEITLQHCKLTAYNGEELRATNIIAKYNPSATTRIILASHWDSRPYADYDPSPENHRKPIDGANDGASSTGVLMEIARCISKDTLALGIDFLFFDAEDYGVPRWEQSYQGNKDATWCLGSQYWARTLGQQDGYAPRYGILLDLVGGKDSFFRREGYSNQYAPAVVSKVWQAAAKLGYDSLFLNEEGAPVTDDHLSLIEIAGIPAIDIIGSNRNGSSFPDTWHTVQDNLDNISKATLKAVGQTVMQVLYDENAQ